MLESIWSLRSADSRNLSLIPHDLDYFQTHFIGKSMRENWKPPPVTIDGKSLRLRDFVLWMAQSPVVSERARDAFEALLDGWVEFLPLVKLRERQYFAVNVLKLVDCLDRKKSEILFSPSEPKRILNINTYSLITGRIEDCPIFKLPDYPSTVFVRQPFVDVVIQSKLTGAKFADPTVSPWISVLNGRSCNVIPGVLD